MPIYVIKQVVKHPNVDRVIIKTSKIIGHDLRHAIQMLPISEGMRRDLEKTNRTKASDMRGRRLEIEIIEEEKA